MNYVLYALAILIAIVFAAHLPILPIARVLKLPVPSKARITACFIKAWAKNCLTILPDISAPLVVPIALLFTKREANKLPWLFTWWDNDASINGDGWAVLRDGKWVRVQRDELPGEVPVEYGDPKYTGDAYYAPGHHPTSFWARFVWLGLRNRASKLSQMLGFKHAPDAAVQTWEGGDKINGSFWEVTCVAGAWRYYERICIGPIYLRLHYGYKVPCIPGRPAAQLIAIGFSMRFM